MKHRWSIWAYLLIVAVVLTACSSKSPESTTVEETTVAEETTAGDEALPVFTAEELAKYNGKDGNSAMWLMKEKFTM